MLFAKGSIPDRQHFCPILKPISGGDMENLPVKEDRHSEADYRRLTYEINKKNPALAAILNVCIAGAGHFYCGKIISGLITFAAVFFCGILFIMIDVFTAGFGLLLTIPAMLLLLVGLFLDGMWIANKVNRKSEMEMLYQNKKSAA
jgi:hypothetical protein